MTLRDGRGGACLLLQVGRWGDWTAPDGKANVAWFTDRNGNVLSLSQV